MHRRTWNGKTRDARQIEAIACAASCGVEKVKTVGDSYLAIAGGNVDADNSADCAIAFARAAIFTVSPQ